MPLFFYLTIFLYGIYKESKITDEIKNFRFEVSEIYFESRFDKRSYLDKEAVEQRTKHKIDELIKHFKEIDKNTEFDVVLCMGKGEMKEGSEDGIYIDDSLKINYVNV
jgi:hypothetical protein